MCCVWFIRKAGCEQSHALTHAWIFANYYFLKSSAQSKHLKTFEQDLSYISKPDHLKGPSGFFLLPALCNSCTVRFAAAECSDLGKSQERMRGLIRWNLNIWSTVSIRHMYSLKKISHAQAHSVLVSAVANPRHCFILAFAPQCS